MARTLLRMRSAYHCLVERAVRVEDLERDWCQARFSLRHGAKAVLALSNQQGFAWIVHERIMNREIGYAKLLSILEQAFLGLRRSAKPHKIKLMQKLLRN